jgi:hypothetical protein
MAKTALVTGASGGIGKCLAERFAADGVNLIIAARSIDRLDAIANQWRTRHGIEITTIKSDLSTADGAQKLFDAVTERGLKIDYLVNNAGVGVFGLFRQAPLNEVLGMLTLNMVSLTTLTRLFLEQIVEARGKILNVASVAAFVPGPYMANYFATKAYVVSFSQAIGEELRGTGVTVTALCPGVTETGFFDQADMHHSGLVKGHRLPTADEVARAGYRAMQRGQAVYVAGWLNKLTVLGLRFVPRRLATRISGFISAPR